ncbi:MAG: endolytic transglycosylase MltG [Desulfobacterales bacterium]|nr:MAG: endolytic transglycosylase MltG [Desulfobacterales bacterium]
MKRLITIASILLLFALVAMTTYAYLDLIRYAKKLPDGDIVEHMVTINPGQGFNSFSEYLYQKRIIEHPFKFRLLARMKRYETKIKAGEYLLSSAMTPEKILDIIVHGKVYFYRLTVPEGYNLRQVARVVETSGFGSREDFLQVATNADFVRRLGIEAETFEGYLFPDTYLFPKGETLEKIISTMVKRFWSAFKPEWKRRAEALDFSIHEVVTLASIIEKEVGAARERPIISSVFHNRLKRNMRLQSDPTVIYGIKNFDGNINRKHLAQPTPYNTYTIIGLPPGPIANAGTDSLEAALYPADTKYLYFVSKKDTTHQFSTNLKDHNNAVRKYQLGK